MYRWYSHGIGESRTNTAHTWTGHSVMQGVLDGQKQIPWGSVCPARAQRANLCPQYPAFSPSFTLPYKSPSTPESTPNPCLFGTQHKTKAANSTCSTPVTCIVPNEQFCPHKSVGQYSQHNIISFYSPQKCGGVLLAAQCTDISLISSTIGWQLSCLHQHKSNMTGNVFPWPIRGGARPETNTK